MTCPSRNAAAASAPAEYAFMSLRVALLFLCLVHSSGFRFESALLLFLSVSGGVLFVLRVDSKGALLVCLGTSAAQTTSKDVEILI